MADGAGVIVAQGSDAGGHGHDGLKLSELIPLVRAAVPATPLVAAGGISNRRGFDTVQTLGAAGVAIGSAFYATHEALGDDAAKQRLVDSTGDETIRSTVYDLVRGPEWPAGYTGRSIRTELTDVWAGRESELRVALEPEIVRYRRALDGPDDSPRVVWAGEGIGDIDRIRPAAQIVERFPLIERTTERTRHELS